MTSLSVIVPSSGRESLKDTVASIAPQMRAGDRLLVDVNNVPWGNAVRQHLMGHVETDAMLFMDDDDLYVPSAFDTIRAKYAEAPGRLHLFRMHYIENDFILWDTQELKVGNVASQMVCAPGPKHAPLGGWGNRYEGDYDFVVSTCAVLGEPVWHEDVICMVHHPGLKGTIHNPRPWADAHHRD